MNKSTSPAKKRRFLIVEDHPIYREAVGLMIRNWFPHSETIGVESVDAAKAALQKSHFDLVILDIELEDRSGLELLDDCKYMEQPPKILVVSKKRSRPFSMTVSSSQKTSPEPWPKPPSAIITSLHTLSSVVANWKCSCCWHADCSPKKSPPL